jgi:YHS domain-containing protein
MGRLTDRINTINGLGRSNLAEKGVVVAENATTYEIMGKIAEVSGGGGGTRSEITCSTAGEVMFAGYFDSTDRTATKANDGLAIVGYCTRFNNSKYSYFACYVGESSESVQATNIKSTTPSTIEYGGKTYYYTCTSTINRELDTKNAWLIGTYEDGYVNTSGFICNAAAVRRLLDYYFCKINE